EGRLERAVAIFNESDAPRTVAGLCRSLGQPTVSVGAAAGSAGAVRVTVAWELCWYQWGVDVSADGQPVFRLANGGEVDELDRSAPHLEAACHSGECAP